MAAVAALAVWHCGSGDNLAARNPVTAVIVSPGTYTIAPGGAVQLRAATQDARGAILTDREIAWSSSDIAVATVNSTGVVVGVADGSATVTARSEGKSGTAAIVVLSPPVPVATVAVDPESASLAPSQTLQLTAVVTGADENVLTDRPVSWSSSDIAVAAVSRTGLVTGVSEGTATITAAAEGKSGSAVIAVTLTRQTFTTVTPAFDHTCALTASGAAYCWGYNASGQLGNGSLVNTLIPVPVSNGLRFTLIAGGADHSCGLVASGVAYCWGTNEHGELGTGGGPRSATPVPVSGDLRLITLVVGGSHTCGLTNTGAAYCWGWNEDGELGSGSFDASPIPIAVLGGLSFTSIIAGAYHTCGLISGGAAYCWGWNYSGQLGNGQLDNSPIPVAVSRGLSFSSLAAGFSWHSCGLTIGGDAYCWGEGGSGELGDGAQDHITLSPHPVLGGLKFSTLTNGFVHTCGRTTAGKAYCWGDDHWGELGDSSVTCEICESTTPTAVYGDLSFRTLDAGGGHNCGLTYDGVAYCWGRNEFGQLGNGSHVQYSAPVAVAGQVRTDARNASWRASPLPSASGRRPDSHR
ncbi:MAG: Ig-like domain-containing protein [Gemmatimonadales bacterium]